MKNMKYIVLDHPMGELPIMFDPLITHGDVASRMVEFGTPVSAGFIDLVDGEVSAFGESVNLELCSRPQDSSIIGKMLGQHT